MGVYKKYPSVSRSALNENGLHSYIISCCALSYMSVRIEFYIFGFLCV